MNSENCPSQMIFILLLLPTDPIALKEVKTSTGLSGFFLRVPFLAIATAVIRIFSNCKQEKKVVSCVQLQISVYMVNISFSKQQQQETRALQNLAVLTDEQKG